MCNFAGLGSGSTLDAFSLSNQGTGLLRASKLGPVRCLGVFVVGYWGRVRLIPKVTDLGVYVFRCFAVFRSNRDIFGLDRAIIEPAGAVWVLSRST